MMSLASETTQQETNEYECGSEIGMNNVSVQVESTRRVAFNAHYSIRRSGPGAKIKRVSRFEKKIVRRTNAVKTRKYADDSVPGVDLRQKTPVPLKVVWLRYLAMSFTVNTLYNTRRCVFIGRVKRELDVSYRYIRCEDFKITRHYEIAYKYFTSE